MAGRRFLISRRCAAPRRPASNLRSNAGRATAKPNWSWVQEVPGRFAGVILNAGAYSHTSVALLDALRALNIPLIEVHLSNIYQRESFRQHSHVSLAAEGVICGFGPQGYTLALRALAVLLHDAP